MVLINGFSIEIGTTYSRKELSEKLGFASLKTSREGIYYSQVSNDALLFVDLVKTGKVDRFHFDDFFEGEFFHWDTQTTQHIGSPRIQQMVNGILVNHLFVRVNSRIRSVVQPYVYCGRLDFQMHEVNTEYPSHIVFHNIDYQYCTDNIDLLNVYNWTPEKIGGESKTYLRGSVDLTEQRKRRYSPPNVTERSGLVTSRVGQGYYRQEIINLWNGRCPLTGIQYLPLLIASHIVPWSESSEIERMDKYNGILLASNYDSLFDRYLLSFNEFGEMKLSSSLTEMEYKNLGIDPTLKLDLLPQTKIYMERHYLKFIEKNN